MDNAAKEKEKRKLIKAENAKKRLYKFLGLKRNDEKNNKPDPSKKKKVMPKRNKKKESDSEEDALCLVCLKPYSESNFGQDWIQRISCKKWAHIDCGKDTKLYTCIHCSSDMEMSDSD